jgi:hypothetical protein
VETENKAFDFLLATRPNLAAVVVALGGSASAREHLATHKPKYLLLVDAICGDQAALASLREADLKLAVFADALRGVNGAYDYLTLLHKDLAAVVAAMNGSTVAMNYLRHRKPHYAALAENLAVGRTSNASPKGVDKVDYRAELSVMILNRSGWHHFGKSLRLPFVPTEGMKLELGGKLAGKTIEYVSWSAEGWFFIGISDEQTFFDMSNPELLSYMRSLGLDHIKSH